MAKVLWLLGVGVVVLGVLLAVTAPDMAQPPDYPPGSEPDSAAADAAAALLRDPAALHAIRAQCAARASPPPLLHTPGAAVTALVTGANGFLGATLVELLLRRGWHVLAAHRPGADVRLLEEVQVEVGVTAAARLALVEADINNATALLRAVPENLDAMFHVAAAVDFGRDPTLRQRTYRANCVGTRNVVAVCATRSVRRLVHTSSVGVYFALGRKGPVTETTPKGAANLSVAYLHSKLLAEAEVYRGIAENGLWATIVQPGAIVGR